MAGTQLYQYFKDRDVTPQEVADATGYTYTYVIELLRGTEPLSDSARFRFLKAYPETTLFLLYGSDETVSGSDVPKVVPAS